MKKISGLIIAKNEESMIASCIDTLTWCDEVLVIDSGSQDETVKVAESKGARVISFNHPSFARLREEALKHAQGDWVLYLDADERVTPKLAKEIQVNIETNGVAALRMTRQNYQFGSLLKHGGWGQDQVTRVFNKSALRGWSGEVHESPIFDGEVKELSIPLLHLTHRSVVDGLLKSAAWTPIEANMIFEALSEKNGKTKVTSLSILRKGFMEFVRRYFLKKGYMDGQPGFMEAIIQAFNRAIVYIQVWELQQKPSIKNKYQELESEVSDLWKKEP